MTSQRQRAPEQNIAGSRLLFLIIKPLSLARFLTRLTQAAQPILAHLLVKLARALLCSAQSVPDEYCQSEQQHDRHCRRRLRY